MYEDLLQLLLRPPLRVTFFSLGCPQHPTEQMRGVLATARRGTSFRIIEA